jgi:hypothetical protein
MTIEAIALLLVTLFLTALGLERVALDPRMDMLQISFFLVLPMFQEYKVLAGQHQRPPETGNANNEVTLLTTEALIPCLNTLLGIT